MIGLCMRLTYLRDTGSQFTAQTAIASSIGVCARNSCAVCLFAKTDQPDAEKLFVFVYSHCASVSQDRCYSSESSDSHFPTSLLLRHSDADEHARLTRNCGTYIMPRARGPRNHISRSSTIRRICNNVRVGRQDYIHMWRHVRRDDHSSCE